MKNFIQKGEVVNYTNSTGSDIDSGAVVVIGKLLGIAVTDIADTETGAVKLEGVYELAKTTSLIITQGDEVFWNTSTKKVTKTVTDKPLGTAFGSELTNATTVKVLLAETGGAAAVAATVAALGTTTNFTAIGGSFADLAAARTAVNTLATEAEARLDAVETKVDSVIAALKAAGLMA